MDEESTKGKPLADVAGSLLTPCCHLGDDDSDSYNEGGDLDDGFLENGDEDFEKEESESFLPRSAVAKRISFRLILKKNCFGALQVRVSADSRAGPARCH